MPKAPPVQRRFQKEELNLYVGFSEKFNKSGSRKKCAYHSTLDFSLFILYCR